MNAKIEVKGVEINIINKNNDDFISLTDMIKAKEGDFFIADWLRNRSTVEFLGIWEGLYNPNFNYGGFAIIKSKAGLNNYKISIKEWVKQTNAIGLQAVPGRYGGTYAHKDIAFEFGMWISAEFKIYLIKEFQRLKDQEGEKQKLGWNAKRMLTRMNYRIHTDAIKKHIVPKLISKKQATFIYVNEADMLNVALLGLTAKEWKCKNKNKKGNIRDYADVRQLVCLASLESLNAEFIRQNLSQAERLQQLNEIAVVQMASLLGNKNIKKLKRH